MNADLHCTTEPQRSGASRWMLLGLFLGLTLVVGGCRPDLSECDQLRSRQIVYDLNDGTPAYEGQALIISSCGNGSFCHSEQIDLAARVGTPAGLEFDLRPAVVGPLNEASEAAAIERLRHSHDTLFSSRHSVMEQVESGAMPPSGMRSEQILASAPLFVGRDPLSLEDRPLPQIGSDEGREILRNWLSCGAPVVERSVPPTMTADDPVGFFEPGLDLEPIEARWNDLYERMFVTRCATPACHGETGEGGLDLRGSEQAYRALLDVPALVGGDCEESGLSLLVAGDAESSLLFLKMRGHFAESADVCGRSMPIGGRSVSDESLSNIAAWIDAGAAFD